jgi:hypothetical protein
LERTTVVKETEVRLRAVLRAAGDDAVSLALALVVDESPTVDESLAFFLRFEYMRPKIQQLAWRIWCERDRDRDPQPLVDFLGDEPRVEPNGGRGLFAEIVNPPVVVLFMYGSSRLRRLEPVAQYDRILSGDFSLNTRIGAAIGLGDTGEAAALTPLLKGLADADPRVRAHSADAVRRLVNAGAREVVKQHDVSRLLVHRLGDRDRRVRIAALRALGAAGLVEPVEGFAGRSRRERAEAERVRDGEIPPLEPTWPGDDTTASRGGRL